LIIELKRILGRLYEDLIDGLMMLPEEFDAYELKRAMRMVSDNKKHLIHFLMSDAVTKVITFN
jgi:hypothetical protein